MKSVVEIPELPAGCGSWIVIRRDTGAVAFEAFDRRVLEALNPDKVIVKTAIDHLQWLNRKTK